MKKFLQISVSSIVVALIAGILYICDSLIARNIIPNSSFMWVSFVSWTVFFGVPFKDRIKALIGCIIGFLAALAMIYFGMLFDATIIGISIAGLIGVILVNAIVMYFENFKKLWLNNTSGIFVGMLLTFSGLGVGLSPTNGVAETFTMLGIIILYSVLGLLCGFCSITFINKFKKKPITVEKLKLNEISYKINEK